jgi:hypothetical protein
MHKYITRLYNCITWLHTSCGRIVSYFEDAPVAVRLLPKGAAALVPCDRAQFLSHFQKFHISCTKVRLRVCVRACVVHARGACLSLSLCVGVFLRVHGCVWAGMLASGRRAT